MKLQWELDVNGNYESGPYRLCVNLRNAWVVFYNDESFAVTANGLDDAKTIAQAHHDAQADSAPRWKVTADDVEAFTEHEPALLDLVARYLKQPGAARRITIERVR